MFGKYFAKVIVLLLSPELPCQLFVPLLYMHHMLVISCMIATILSTKFEALCIATYFYELL